MSLSVPAGGPGQAGELVGTWAMRAVPDSVPRLRQAVLQSLAGVAVDHDAVALAVSEAFSNTIRHAYRAASGTVTAEIHRTQDHVMVVVEDQGCGIFAAHGALRLSSPSLGVGLQIISTLADTIQIVTRHGVGTRVEMAFPISAPDCHNTPG